MSLSIAWIDRGRFEDGPAKERQLAIAERRQVKQGVILVALHLRGRQAGLLVGEQVLEDASKPLPVFDNLSLILPSLGEGDGEVTAVILGQFEQPDIGGEGRPICNLAGCSEHTGGFGYNGLVRGALLTTPSALAGFRSTRHGYFCYPRERSSALSTNTPDAMLLQRARSQGAGSIDPTQ